MCNLKNICHDLDCVTCKGRRFIEIEKFSNLAFVDVTIDTLVISRRSHENFLFRCKNCNHEFIGCPHELYVGYTCRYCHVGTVICLDENCRFCYFKSFASDKRKIFWSDDNRCPPRHAAKTSVEMFKFNCNCGHEFISRMREIMKNVWCPYCSVPQRRRCLEKSCVNCKNLSFESHPMSKYWSNENIEKPREVSRNSNKRYKFDCPYCKNLYISILQHVNQGMWCGCRKYKSEEKLFKFLKLKYNASKQVNFEWMNYNRLKFDFCIEQFKILIELDGEQHF